MAEPRARLLGTARLSPTGVEFDRMGVAPGPAIAFPIVLKVWDATPHYLRDLAIAIGALGGDLLPRDGAPEATSAVVTLPPDILPEDLPTPLARALRARERLRQPPPPLRCGPRTLTFDRTHVMAIINLTDDSFSGDGFGADTDAALRHAARAIKDGATIVDVGGESARADVPIREEQEEIERVVPVIERIAAELDVIVSVDTWKPAVAEAAARAGAMLLNDIGGLKLGPGMAQVAARHGLPLVLNHTWMRPKVRPPSPPVYGDVIDAVYAFLEDRIAEAKAHGVAEDQLVIDPGIAFGKSHDEDLEAMRRLGELRSLGRPILLAHSRKHVIGSALGGLPPEERVEGTLAISALAVAAGADIVRVHDVRATARAVRVTDALVRARPGDYAHDPERWPFPLSR
ncbi:MAG: dihydropteroate synthase [Dehalococcoidia bacterium]|nr:dihydropteroate synthase [Dehalococcoidia bacterium]